MIASLATLFFVLVSLLALPAGAYTTQSDPAQFDGIVGGPDQGLLIGQFGGAPCD